MITGLEVTFSKSSEKDFENILTYIKNNFGSVAAIEFKISVFNFVTLIKDFPEIGSLEVADKKIRGFVLHRRLKIFYRIKTNKVILLRLFDTRQNPGHQK